MTNADQLRPSPASPLVVNFGGGVDSTAILVGLVERGIRPDLVIFADTGAERPETYRWIETFSEWLASKNFPTVTIVRVATVRAPYETIEGNCLANSTLPSLAFGRGSCSSRWKAEPMDRWLATWAPALGCWEAGAKIVKAIGYDNGCADSRRVKKAEKLPEDPKVEFWYPLRDWGWDREECQRQILAAVGTVPGKSACFFCPGSKECELRDLAEKHPQMFRRAIRLEDKAQPNLLKIEGLWRKSTKTRPGSWRAFAEAEGLPLPEDDANLPHVEEIERSAVEADRATRKAAGEKITSLPVPETPAAMIERHGLAEPTPAAVSITAAALRGRPLYSLPRLLLARPALRPDKRTRSRSATAHARARRLRRTVGSDRRRPFLTPNPRDNDQAKIDRPQVSRPTQFRTHVRTTRALRSRRAGMAPPPGGRLEPIFGRRAILPRRQSENFPREVSRGARLRAAPLRAHQEDLGGAQMNPMEFLDSMALLGADHEETLGLLDLALDLGRSTPGSTYNYLDQVFRLIAAGGSAGQVADHYATPPHLRGIRWFMGSSAGGAQAGSARSQATAARGLWFRLRWNEIAAKLSQSVSTYQPNPEA